MSFLTPLFFLGVAALAAPILVHLVRRTRARRVQFPALVFVRQVPQRTIRRRTLHNLLLLLLRCLAILLIVIAFTRPFFSGGSAAKDNSAAGATVILIDNSLSMRREQLFAEAQRRAEAAIDEARNDEQVALLSFDKRYTVLNRFTSDKNRVRAAVSSLSAGWDGTDYEQALRGAESLLGEIETTGPKRIVMISDFQAPGWTQASATFKLGKQHATHNSRRWRKQSSAEHRHHQCRSAWRRFWTEVSRQPRGPCQLTLATRRRIRFRSIFRSTSRRLKSAASV